MAEQLIIRISPGDPSAGRWVVIDAEGIPVSAAESGPLSDACAPAAGRRVVVLVPATEVLRTSIKVPVKNPKKILQLLPFAMEDQLAEDIGDLHFAAGRPDSTGNVPVAVLRRAQLEEWRDHWQTAGLDVQAVYAESDGLDHMPGTAVLLVEADRVCFRDEAGELSSVDTDSLNALLTLWLHRDHGDARPHLVAYLAPDCAQSVQVELDTLRPELETLDSRVLADGALPRLAAGVIANPGVNLLQGNFARRSDFAKYWPAWRLAASLLIALVIVATATKIAENRRLEKRAEYLQAAAQQAFRYLFPDAREVRDPRAALNSRLRALGQTTGKSANGFLDTLETVSRALSDSGTGTQLESVDYRKGIMELRLRVPDVETLDRIQKTIDSDARLTAEIQSANADDDQILGRLRIESGA